MYVFEIDTGLHYSQAYASTIEINRENGRNATLNHFVGENN